MERAAAGAPVGGVVLDGATREALARRYDATRDAAARTRYQIVLLAGEGRSAEAIAAVVRRSRSTVWRVLQRYRAGGPDAVPPGAGRGTGTASRRRGRRNGGGSWR